MTRTESTDALRSTAKPSLSVVAAVADADGVDPVDLDPPLNDCVDPSALDDLIGSIRREEHGARSVSISFEYRGYDVTVDGDGNVALE